MDWIPKGFGLLIQGASTNWWGLGCPAHCHPSGVPTLLLAFGFGTSLGFIFGCLSCLWIFGLLTPSTFGLSCPASSQPADRVRAYLHEPGPILRFRSR